MKVSSRGYGDAVRGLSHGKGAKVSIGRGTPAKREGSDGDLTLRNTNRGVILYAKYGGRWYSIHTQQALAAGMIIMWSGATTTIPGGWALCNGNNGTPDLRAKFIISSGTGTGYPGGDGSYTDGGSDPFIPGEEDTQAVPVVPAHATVSTATTGGHGLTALQLPDHTHRYAKSNNHPEMDPSVVGVSVADDADTITDTTHGGGKPTAVGDTGGTHTHTIPAVTINQVSTTSLPNPGVDWYCLAFIMFMGTGAEPGTEGYNWGGGSGELGREGGG